MRIYIFNNCFSYWRISGVLAPRRGNERSALGNALGMMHHANPPIALKGQKHPALWRRLGI